LWQTPGCGKNLPSDGWEPIPPSVGLKPHRAFFSFEGVNRRHGVNPVLGRTVRATFLFFHCVLV
jgi:hypothetical protein